MQPKSATSVIALVCFDCLMVGGLIVSIVSWLVGLVRWIGGGSVG